MTKQVKRKPGRPSKDTIRIEPWVWGSTYDKLKALAGEHGSINAIAAEILNKAMEGNK